VSHGLLEAYRHLRDCVYLVAALAIGCFELDQNGRLLSRLQSIMGAFIFRCPATGRNVQGWFADDVSGNEGETYESVTCLACQQVHLLSRLTGKLLANDEE
jgi:hypothetical protein